MGQITNSPMSVCLSVCQLSYGSNSYSILMKLYTIDWNPKRTLLSGSNSDHCFPYFPPFFTPIMNCQWQGLSTTVSNHADRLWHLIAQRTLLGSSYTGRGVVQTSHVPAPSFPLSPLFFSSYLPSPSRPLHSPPLPLEVGLLIAAKGCGSALVPPAGLATKWYLVNFKLKILSLVAENEISRVAPL